MVTIKNLAIACVLVSAFNASTVANAANPVGRPRYRIVVTDTFYWQHVTGQTAVSTLNIAHDFEWNGFRWVEFDNTMHEADEYIANANSVGWRYYNLTSANASVIPR